MCLVCSLKNGKLEAVTEDTMKVDFFFNLALAHKRPPSCYSFLTGSYSTKPCSGWLEA